jgi:hypothetical protein
VTPTETTLQPPPLPVQSGAERVGDEATPTTSSRRYAPITLAVTV